MSQDNPDLKSFVVVHFFEEDSVEVIPKTWLNNSLDHCCFLKKIPNNFSEIRSNSEAPPNSKWSKFPVLVIKSYGKQNINL